MKTVKIGAGAGDILSSIPYIKALGGSFVYLTVNLPSVAGWHPINKGGAELLIPFLKSQGLESVVIQHKDMPLYTYDIDMDYRVEYGWHGGKGDIYTWNSLFYGVYPDMTKPFFEIEEVPKRDIIVLSRTARYNNIALDYTFLNTIEMKKIFIGTEAEFIYLKDCFPKIADIEFYQITDYLDASKLIKSSKVFISNQTSFCVLAEGLGVPRVLEVCADFPSVIPKTPNGRPVLTQRYFEKAILELLNKENENS